MDPPRSLAPGDVVESEIEGIGVLRNAVVAVAPTCRRLADPLDLR
jgi:2-keto-4-pentenoate hydratase/2-oxohepta-3-ene-1,7-dioic acid hydratase in catechol pathway